MEGRTRTDGAVQVVFRAVLVPVARMLPCVCRIFAWPRLDLPISRDPIFTSPVRPIWFRPPRSASISAITCQAYENADYPFTAPSRDHKFSHRARLSLLFGRKMGASFVSLLLVYPPRSHP